MWTRLRFATMGITRMLHMHVRHMGITVPAGLPVECLSERARGITDGVGRSIQATAIIADRSAADSLDADMLGADLKAADTLVMAMLVMAMMGEELEAAVRPMASTVQRHAAARCMAEADITVAAHREAVAGR